MSDEQASLPVPIKVVVAGPDGRMGRLLLQRLPDEADLDVIGSLRRDDVRTNELLSAADVLVEFTDAESSPQLMIDALRAGVRPVSGTSGLGEEALTSIDDAARECGLAGVWAPNFRLGGTLAMHLSEIVSRYFGSVEVIETHHAMKADAPSGTAMELARRIRAAHGSDLADPGVASTTLPGVRGGVLGGVHVHSVRLIGAFSTHEVVFSGDRELLTIRHQDLSREAYAPVVAMAARAVMRSGTVGLIRGLDAVMGLKHST